MQLRQRSDPTIWSSNNTNRHSPRAQRGIAMVKQFTLTLRAASGSDGIRSLRALLKIAGRHLGLRAIDVCETPNTAPLWRSAGRCQISSAGVVKMDMRKFSGSQFVKCADVRSGPIRERIAGVEVGKFDKPNLLFESGAVLSVNATNNKTLVRAFARDSESWIGNDVQLFLGEIEYQGKPQEAVLLRTISEAESGKSPAPKKATKVKPDFDDSVEF
jgi:hypothetical protein